MNRCVVLSWIVTVILSFNNNAFAISGGGHQPPLSISVTLSQSIYISSSGGGHKPPLHINSPKVLLGSGAGDKPQFGANSRTDHKISVSAEKHKETFDTKVEAEKSSSDFNLLLGLTTIAGALAIFFISRK